MTRQIVYAINRESPIPAYYQIAVDLRQRISRGEWRAGNKLPAEPELARQYSVSRMTVRQAVSELVEDGVLVRKRGNGTFVNIGFLDVTDPSTDEHLVAFSSEPKRNQLREQVWAALRKVARPDSRFHWNFEEFVPDFEGSEHCAELIRRTDWYRSADLVFAAPDNSLTCIRQYAIEDGKRLVVATYGIARGFSVIEPGTAPAGQEEFAATLDGLERYGKPISLDEIADCGAIDLLITGISLVTEHGVRWGKGHGYFDLEWAMFREIGVVNEATPVIAVGHDCQLVSVELEPSAVDTIVDLIVMPTRQIEVEKIYPKPEGIRWEYISAHLRQQIPPLQELYGRRQLAA